MTRRRFPAWAASVSLVWAGVVLASCGGSGTAAVEIAPDSFTVAFESSEGPFAIEFVRAWSPLAVDRVYALVDLGYWEGARFYRVNERYAQFGYSGDPARDSMWVQRGLPDEPSVESNVRGAVSFARGGPGTRSSILFINRTDNANLDDLSWNGVVGFPPVGRVVSGMDILDGLYAGYGDEPMQWEDSIAALGNSFLDRRYPRLDSITDVSLDPGSG